MFKKNNRITYISGSPQFRIKESKDETAPVYIYYSQEELENDLVNINDEISLEKKQVKTLDDVNTVEKGDILFSLISGEATLVRKRHEGYLFTQNYVRIDVDDKIDSKYLIYLLNEDREIKRQLQISLQGSIVKKYTIKQLIELKLPPLPSLKDQKLIGEIYFNQKRLEIVKQKRAKLETMVVFEKLKEGTKVE